MRRVEPLTAGPKARIWGSALVGFGDMTDRPVRLGLNLPYVERSMDGGTPRWTDILAMAQTAESIGFDGLWISDHVGFGDPEGEWRGAWESWTVLSALAASTSRVALGNYVLARAVPATRRYWPRWPRRSTRSAAGG